MTDILLTTAEVADELRISIRTVYTLVRTGALDCVDLGHRTKRVKRSALDEYIDSRDRRNADS